MTYFKFLEVPLDYNPLGTFVAQLPDEIVGKDELFRQLGKSLVFPDYFGFNWDALFECLRDFSWIKERNIAIVHSEIPILDEKELKIYLSILYESTVDWEGDDVHRLEVVLPKEAELKVRLLFDDSDLK